MNETCDSLVIGGGFYGCTIAAHLAHRGRSVRLIEAGSGLLGRASYSNQARVHQGYHYPRSLMTGFRSRANYERFAAEYADCLHTDFQAVYAIGREHSKVSAAGFDLFCRRIGAPIGPAPDAVRRLFDARTVEAVFAVTEATFDAVKLRNRVAAHLAASGVNVRVNTEVVRVGPAAGGRVRAEVRGAGEDTEVVAGDVYNCTYSGLNRFATASGLPPVPLKHELAEMALVRVPPELADVGVTVMCGPFFSLMPFPAVGLHTLSHVRYTPRGAWSDPRPDGLSADEVAAGLPRVSSFDRMRRDAARFVPAVARAEYVRSLWEVKTVLPANEADDGRPILFRPHAGLENYHAVLGAKIDTVFDVLDRIDGLAGDAPARQAA